MKINDKEVLKALTDYPHFRRFISKVETCARQKAFGLGVNEDAALDAVDKVEDWLMKKEKVDHPASYVDAIIHNALIDYGRAHKSADDIINGDLAKMGVSEIGLHGDEDEGRPIGWHAIRISEKTPKNIREEGLMALRKLDDLLRNPTHVLGLLERRDCGEVKQAHKLLLKQLGNIPGAEQRRVMEYYLRGYRQRDIVNQLNKKKEYISRIVNKWLRIWGWSGVDVERARAILLTRQLAELYLELHSQRDLPEKLYQEITCGFKTKAYFHALPKSAKEDLVELCDSWVDDYAPEIKPDWDDYVDDEAFESWQNEKRARLEFFRSLSNERKRDYIFAWREEAEYWGKNQLLNLVAELEKKLTF